MDKIKILIVEDDRIVAEDIQASLRRLGFAVSAIVSSGEEALKKIKAKHPDLVLMDIMLQGEMNGTETAEKVRSQFNIPVIYVTAYADEKVLELAKITEPYGYIIKPFKDNELNTSIELALYKHKMETRIKESEAWLSTTLKSIGDAVITTDKKGIVTFMNPVARSLTGWHDGEAIGKPLKDVFNIINEKTRKPVKNPVSKVIKSGSIVGLANHTILIAKDGTERPIDDSGAPIRDEGGKIIGVVLTFRDITERKKAETALRESEEKYRMFIDTTVMPITVWDMELRLLLLNAISARNLGGSPADFIGNTMEEILPSMVELSIEQFRKIRETGKGLQMEHKMMMPTGNEIYFWTDMQPMKDTKGDVIAIQITSENITERRRAEQALRESEAKWRSITENSPNTIMTVDANGVILFINRPVDDVSGDKAVIGTSVYNYVEPKDLDTVRSVIGRVFKTGISEIYQISVRDTKGSKVGWYETHAGSVFDGDTVVAVILAAHDITERKQTEEQIQKHNVQLQEAVEKTEREMELLMEKHLQAEKLAAIGQIYGNVAHEIRNPLGSIKQSTFFLKRKMKSYPEIIQKHLNLIDNELVRTNDVITKMLETIDVTPAKREIIDLYSIISEAILRCRIEDRIKLNINLNPKECIVLADPLQLQQVFINLINNSIESISGNGDITISAKKSQSDKKYQVEIKDTGKGIESGMLAKVFNPLYTTKQDGTGLGLGICKQIIEQHEGEISLQSQAGYGTIATILLPIKQNSKNNK